MAEWIIEIKDGKFPIGKWTELVRCKDCKHYNAGFECLIDGYGIERPQTWYCADGERKDEVKE